MAPDPPREQFGDHYRSIYLAGAGGEAPTFRSIGASSPARAAEVLDERAGGYVFGSAGTGATDRANREALDAWRIVPRMLRDVAVRDLRSSPFAAEWPAPVGLAPVGVQTIVHPDGRAREQPGRRRGSGCR